MSKFARRCAALMLAVGLLRLAGPVVRRTEGEA